MTERLSPFDAITLESSAILIEILDGRSLDVDLFARRFRERAANLDETVTFMKALRAIRYEDRNIVSDSQFDKMEVALSRGNETFNKYVVQNVFTSTTSYGQAIRRFVSAFDIRDGLVRARHSDLPTNDYAIRNFLMEAEALQFDPKLSLYWIEEWFSGCFVTARFGSGTTPEKFRKIHEAQTELGLAAEKAVLEYEYQIVDPSDKMDVIHVSLHNISAGFDIASVRRQAGSNIKRILMIEVKAVNPIDWQFSLSRNEIDVAKQNGTHYAVYLVPVRNGCPAISDMEVILNPAQTLCDDYRWHIEKDGWHVRLRS